MAITASDADAALSFSKERKSTGVNAHTAEVGS